MIGQTLGHYKILEKVGEGGMGVLYRALDTHLDRPVAIKVLHPEMVGDPERKRRFVLEAKAASALNHPNIVTIYDIDCIGGVNFIAMEFIDGVQLSRRIESGLARQETLTCARQIASALAAAHAAGIVHRDVKPANIMVTPAGQVKVLDFGIAKLTEAAVVNENDATLTSGGQTREGSVIGTVAYMSPEQAEGKAVDARSDVFSLGVVLYEMLGGRRPFQGDSTLALLTAILHQPPAPLQLPPALEAVLGRCLEKDRQQRYPSAAELGEDLAAVQSRLATPPLLRRSVVLIPALAALLALVAAAVWLAVRNSRVRWARNVALPEIQRLVEQQRFLAAFLLVQQAERYLPNDPRIQQFRGVQVSRASLRTTPPGAEIYLRDYLDTTEPVRWVFFGRSPLETVELPIGVLRCRIVKEGFEPVEGTVPGLGQPRLHTRAERPPGMVWVSGGADVSGPAARVTLDDYWLDQYEVTNRQFKEFVDRAGYQRREFWKHPMVKDGRTLSWEEALAEFRDGTGRPGPAAWELGSYPPDRAESPVTGVSWYEAAAYVEFAGKSLPTVYHWYKAATINLSAARLRLSNFAGSGPARVGAFAGLGAFGTYDLAGNVKEWCANPAGDRYYTLGGGWSEPAYLFNIPDARRPFERSATLGFRCAKYLRPLPEALTGAVIFVSRDRTRDKPVGDEIFHVYKDLHSYDRTELKPAVESVEDSAEHWRQEKVTFQAAYGNERVIARLFLPRNAAPPYQAVILFPGADALSLRSSESQQLPTVGFFTRSGRAVLLPVYKGTYERGPSAYYHRLGQPNFWREMNIQWSKDLSRAIDYLETRPDIDREKLAFHGGSLGAAQGPRLTAVETRFRASILLMGGFFEKVPPEVDPLHFAPRAKVPTLMLNGREDFLFPLQTSQLPLFRLLGTPERDKRHVLFDCGHDVALTFRQQMIKEILDWLDRYLGPVALH